MAYKTTSHIKKKGFKVKKDKLFVEEYDRPIFHIGDPRKGIDIPIGLKKNRKTKWIKRKK